LSQTDLRQLAQRVTARYHLNPLNREETSDYIRHRLGVAGGAGKVLFAPAALRAIHRFSSGTPRLINLVCDRALLAGFVLGKREIDRKIVKRAIGELDAVHKNSKPKGWWASWKFRGAFAAFVLAALALAFQPEAQHLLPWPSSEVTEVTKASKEPVAVEPASNPEEEDLAGVSSEEFELRLRTLSRELSRRGSAAAVLGRWGTELGGGLAAFSPEESLRAMAGRLGLEATQLRTHLDQIRRINLPVVLELFHTVRNDTCFAALVGLDDKAAVLAFGPDDTLRVPLETLEQFWVHRAHVFWKDFEELSGSGLRDTRAQAWVKENLQELGYLAGEVEPTDDAIDAGLTRFQSSAYLAADGVVGPQTRMALYSLSGRYPVPRLNEP
jgi:general secretion pathway protein A